MPCWQNWTINYNCNVILFFFLIKKRLQFQSFFDLHDFLDDAFRHRVPLELGNPLNHLFVRFPLVLQRFGFAVINVVLLGQLIQSVDPRVPAFQAFGQMRPRAHVLIPRPMKFDARFGQ